MSELYEALLVDVGNTRTKAAVVHQGRLEVQEETCDRRIRDWVKQVHQVVFASVGDPAFGHWLKQLCQKERVQFIQPEPQVSAYGIVCGYEVPANLGVDRWLAMVGARQLTTRAFAVLDFGTAITCDFVDQNGKHLGGWIIPGIAMMRASLVNNTQGIYAEQGHWCERLIGRDTQSCVDSGCQSAAEGVLKQAEEHCRSEFSDYDLFLCGGDGERFSRQNPRLYQYKPDLVFSGMARIGREFAGETY